MLRLSIPEPCHEDWSKMTPTQKGAFCAACSKEVVDFSLMSDDQVKNYFLLHTGKKTCGRFHNHQLKKISLHVDENILYTRIPVWKKFLAVLLICFGSVLLSCNNGEKKNLGETADLTQIEAAKKIECTTTTSNHSENKKQHPGDSVLTGNAVITVPDFHYTKGDIVPQIEPEMTMGVVAEPPEDTPVANSPITQKKDTPKIPSDSCNLLDFY